MYDIFKDTIPVKLVSINQVPNEYKRGGGDSGCNGKGYAVIGEQKTGKVLEVKEIDHIKKTEKITFIDEKYKKFKKDNNIK